MATKPFRGNGMAKKRRRFLRWKFTLAFLLAIQVVVICFLHYLPSGSLSSMSSSLGFPEDLYALLTEATVEKSSVAVGRSAKTLPLDKRMMLSFNYTKSNSTNLWENSITIPDWMKNYFQWHGEQMARLNETTWKDMRYLVMQCLETDDHCGGTADRLKPVPTMLLVANQTRRLLMIRWERPCKLEEFLVPPRGGMDWRIPDWLEPKLSRKPYGGSLNPIVNLAKSNRFVSNARYQSHNAGAPYFDEHNEGTGTTFDGVYRDLWKVMFTPVPPIANMISESMRDMGLMPGQYASAHLRALYAIKHRDPKATEMLAINAVNCASQLNPGNTIYFASDSSDAISSIKKYATKNSRRIVALQDDENPLHLEKAENWTERHPSEYYSTFRDLYIIGFSHCVAYNVGGYGHWGLMLSDDSTCGNRYISGGQRQVMVPCDWRDGESEAVSSSIPPRPPPLEPPIENPLDESVTGHIKKESIIPNNILNQTRSSTLPPWLEEYFEWHAEQRKELSESNWESKRYLVMQCTLDDDRCGGTADRLKSLPLMLYLAHHSRRILMIWWERPCKLEAFLVPPADGLDWRVPHWLQPKLVDTRKAVVIQRVERFVDGDDVILRTRIQLQDGGDSIYAQHTNGTSFAEFYREMFHKVFVPSPPLATTLSDAMKRLGLKPGEYAAAHLRAVYARESRPPGETAALAINAVNCASQLRPGGPIFFAADSKHAVESVQKYAVEKNRPIVTVVQKDEPLHLEKAENGTSRHPSEYFATFVDLYLLGESRCLSYSNGGFGTWGLLIGHNSSCSSRHFHGRRMMRCEWADAAPAQ